MAIPDQIIHPHGTGYLVQSLPLRFAVLRRIPCPEGQRRQARCRSKELFWRTQGLHAGVGHPWAFQILFRSIEDAQIPYANTEKCETGREAAHPTADDHNVERITSTRLLRRWDPFFRRITEAGQILLNPAIQSRQSPNTSDSVFY